MTRIDPVERHLFLEGVYLRYGYDFRQYSEASLNRRLLALLDRYKTANLLDVLKDVLGSPATFREVLPYLTINTSEFFRDPAFFRALREEVIPILKTYHKFSVWIAGCSTGEEVASLAILLREEGLLKRATIHATDINFDVLKRAKEGIYELSSLQTFNRNYVAAGGLNSPSEYYTAEYGLARFDPTLFQDVVFSEHNLVTDAGFIEAQLILCRNVLIYFNRDLQTRVFKLFAESLAFRGFLGLGSKETLRFSGMAPYFDLLESNQNIYCLKSQPIQSWEQPGESTR